MDELVIGLQCYGDAWHATWSWASCLLLAVCPWIGTRQVLGFDVTVPGSRRYPSNCRHSAAAVRGRRVDDTDGAVRGRT